MNVYEPSLEEFNQLVKDQPDANLFPIYREFSADLETPVTVYLKLMTDSDPSFLLESVVQGEQVGRYSFIGINPRAVISVTGRTVTDTRCPEPFELAPGQDIMHVLQSDLEGYTAAVVPNLPRLRGGAIGYLGYDSVRFFEKLPETATRVVDIPDAVFMLADTFVVFDHARNRLQVISNAALNGDRSPQAVAQAYVKAIQMIEQVSEKLLRPLPAVPNKRWGVQLHGEKGKLYSNKTEAEFGEMVLAAKEYIAAGDIFQVVLSQRFERKTDAHPFQIYRALRMLNPSPYLFYLNFGGHDFQVVGASPEMHVLLEDGIANLRPIAGTRKRGENEAEDRALENELLHDPKERAEHVMLVDLGRNDLGRVCKYGSVNVSEMMVIERYSHVMHIVSHVKGEINPEMDAYDLVRATFPAGTLSGAPKVRAMEIIEALEGERRGLYGGVIGYFSYDGSSDTCIAIRTMVMRGETVYIQAGGGIVADSEPRLEFEESHNKAKAVVRAIDLAEQGGF